MTDYRPPYRGAILAGAGILALYVLTLSPSTAMWDASEYIATAHILGIPHPPGNPFFVALSRVWSLLLAPLGLPVAVRVNLLAAATSAGAAAFYFLVAHRVLWGFSRDRALAMVGAGAAVLLSATAFTVWSQSTVNEKVYTLSVLITAAVVWLALRWRDRRHEPGAIRFLLWAIYLMALGSTSHLMSVLPLPALVLFVLLAGPGVLLNRQLWIRGALLFLVGISFNFFLPIRAAQNPVINEGDPTCQGVGEAVVAVYSLGQTGCENLARVLTRFQYRKPPLTERQSPFHDQLLNFFQYFDWQWGRGLHPSETPGNTRLPVTLLFLLLGVGGIWVAWRGDRGSFWLLGGLALTLTVGLVFYLNFKYGYSWPHHVPDRELREVRERDYFFIASFSLWGALAGMGLAALWDHLARRVRAPRPRLLAAPALAVALIPLAFNWAWASRAGDWATRDWAYNLLMSVEPYGILFTNGDNDTFPLWYVQEVEGIRRDVTVAVGQYLYTTWYPRQLQELTSPERQRPFLPEQGGGIHEAPPVPPSRSIIGLAPEDLDRVSGRRFPGEVTVPLGEVAIQYPAGSYLDRGDQITLAMILYSLPERPVYFATPSGILGSLGLEPWAVRHGLAAKLMPRDLDGPQPPGLVQTSRAVGGDWFDVERSLRLVEEVYTYRSLRDREIWADRSTLNIPWYFYATHLQLADAVVRWGGDDEVERALALREAAQSFWVTAQGGSRTLPPDTGEGG